VSFSQLPSVKKDTENCAPGNFFGPSYFVMTLEAPLALQGGIELKKPIF
jgi:hypothetical protein